MTTAELVNRICDKLRTGRVLFGDIGRVIEFAYAAHTYLCWWDTDGKIIKVSNRYSPLAATFTDNYSMWLEGVLNGKTRNDAGDLS